MCVCMHICVRVCVPGNDGPCVYTICSQGWKMFRGLQDLAYDHVLALREEMVLLITMVLFGVLL